jgi:DNA-binding CsgD family transcriptional regulator
MLPSVALISCGLCDLPAVPTLDWADRAAISLATGIGSCRVVLTVRSVGGDGSLGPSEIGGVATLTHRELPALHTGHRVPLTDQDRPAQLVLRSRAEMLPTLGVSSPPALHESGHHACFSGAIADYADSADGAGRAEMHIAEHLWSGMSVRRTVIGIGAMGTVAPEGIDSGHSHTRSIVAIVGLFDDSDARVDAVRTLLGTVMPHVVIAAVNALGATPMDSSQWITAREQRVLERLALGKSVREIAAEFDRSPHTVHDHVKSLHRKLGASSRGALIARLLGHIDCDAPATSPTSGGSPDPGSGADGSLPGSGPSGSGLSGGGLSGGGPKRVILHPTVSRTEFPERSDAMELRSLQSQVKPAADPATFQDSSRLRRADSRAAPQDPTGTTQPVPRKAIALSSLDRSRGTDATNGAANRFRA